jgi:hypothetical protein
MGVTMQQNTPYSISLPPNDPHAFPLQVEPWAADACTA